MIVVTGAAHVIHDDHTQEIAPPRSAGAMPPIAACDASPWLREQKSRKYMGLQDEMAVITAGQALEMAGARGPLAQRAGLYMAVGYIPFERRDALPVLTGSVDEEARFSMQRFAAGGYQRAHPLLTFRCLPNMPAYHVSANFGVEGPYLVTYPGPGQMYLAVEQACAALEDGSLELALCGGVAHQRNFLVEHHHARLTPPVARERLRDAAGFLLLEQEAHARARGAVILARLEELGVGYRPFDPRTESCVAVEQIDGVRADERAPELGPATLPILVSRSIAQAQDHGRRTRHEQFTRDGYACLSVWSAP